MLPSILSSSILFLASSSLVDAAGYATITPQFPSCQGFDTTSNDTIPLPSQDLIISPGVVCNVAGSNYSTSCDVISGGWPTMRSAFLDANGSRILSNATHPSVTYALGWTVWNVTGDSKAFYGGSIVAVENQTVTFDNGTSGDGMSWLSRTPIYYYGTEAHCY